jgi:hypothetical protein
MEMNELLMTFGKHTLIKHVLSKFATKITVNDIQLNYKFLYDQQKSANVL